MSISKQDHERIAAAIQAAESKTSCEIVCVLAQTSTHTSALSVFIAAVVSLVTPWLLTAFTAITVQRILSLQALVFLTVLLVFCIPRLRVALLPRKARRAIAHRAAMEQFINRGIGRTADRRGILIFVSLAERYARIIPDGEIATRVPQTKWQSAIDELVIHMHDGHIADGFVNAINVCGDELANNFPRTVPKNLLPDRLYLL